MKLTIIREDNLVIIDGRALSVDCTSLPADLHAVQWSGISGHVERQGLMNQPIDSLAAFQSVIDLWITAADAIDNPPPLTLEQEKEARSALINLACQTEIYAGFDSSALGSLHHYPAKAQDQSNLVASVTASLLPSVTVGWTTPFWCADEAGVWDYTLHTAAQIQQAGSDGKLAILAALGKNETLQRQIIAATTVADVQAVTW